MKYILLFLLAASCGKEEPGESKRKVTGRIDIYIHFDVILPKVLPFFEEDCHKKYQDLLEPDKTEAIQDCVTEKIDAILLYLEEAKKEYEP